MLFKRKIKKLKDKVAEQEFLLKKHNVYEKERRLIEKQSLKNK